MVSATGSSDYVDWLAQNKVPEKGGHGAAETANAAVEFEDEQTSKVQKRLYVSASFSGKVFSSEGRKGPAGRPEIERAMRSSKTLRNSLEKLRSMLHRAPSGLMSSGSQAMDAMWQDAEENDSSDAAKIVVPKRHRWQGRSSIELGDLDSAKTRVAPATAKPERHPWPSSQGGTANGPKPGGGHTSRRRLSLGLLMSTKCQVSAGEGPAEHPSHSSQFRRSSPSAANLHDAASPAGSTQPPSPTSSFGVSATSSPYCMNSPAPSSKDGSSPRSVLRPAGTSGGGTEKRAGVGGRGGTHNHGWAGRGWLQKTLWKKGQVAS